MIAFADAVLTTARVRLRWFTEADAPALYVLYSNPEVARYLSRPPMTDPAQAERLLRNALDDYGTGLALPFAIERSEDGAFVGNCTLFHFHEASRRAEIGYSLARPFWGRGYMHEALGALVGYAFDVLDLNRLEADIDPRNAGSEKSLLRLGFRKEGLLRERWIVSGEVSDTGFYGLLRSDWRRAHGDR